jgi:hypothetical protein
MLDTTNFAISSLVAHAHLNPEAQREFQLAVARLVANHPPTLSLPQKQLGLICVLEKLVKSMPADYQPANTLAMLGTLLFGTRTMAAITQIARGQLIEDA